MSAPRARQRNASILTALVAAAQTTSVAIRWWHAHTPGRTALLLLGITVTIGCRTQAWRMTRTMNDEP